MTLLAQHEPLAVSLRQGAGSTVIVCDHASHRLPARVGDLGLSARQLRLHIGWDLGALDVATAVAGRLDGSLVAQNYSRLVIDCNRPPTHEQSIVVESEGFAIPGNERISPADRQAREVQIFRPYHAAIEAQLDRKTAPGRQPLLVSMHSFTKTFLGQRRPWHIGVLYNRDNRYAHAIIGELRRRWPELVIGDNEPYPVNDITHYTIPVHGEARGIPHVMFEIRNDQLTDADGRARWSDRLAEVLSRAADSL